jgi:4-methyl-5(b-hydroxyethyl)-thiazole monophosphate biosynthesis
MKKVLLLLANGFEMYEASVFIDVIGWNEIAGDKSTKLFTCGTTKEVNTSFGQKMIVNHLISEINTDDFDALAIPGGFEEYKFYQDAYSEPFLDIIRRFDKAKKIISSICVAALPVAKSGVLNGRFGTTYNQDNERRLRQLEELGVLIRNEPIVIDENVITSWNPSTAIDVAFILLEKITSREQKEYIMNIMGY